MPWRFYRYMLFDVLRQFAITATILVIVVAFGAAIKPLSSENLVSGWDTLKYLFLAIIPMLQFALPFAGAFAATICLHRMAQDNEFIAMAVCGQSYIRLLAPMAFFGVVLTIIVAVLTQSIIPMFIGKMAQAITADLPKLLKSSIEQETPFVQGDLVIWAKDIFPGADGQEERMALDQVAVAKLDRDGSASMYFTASAAVIDIARENNVTSLSVEMRNTTQWTRSAEGAGVLKGAPEGRLTHEINLPSLTNQRLTALSMGDLRNLQEHPEEYSYVKKAAISLKTNLSIYEFQTSIHNQVAETGELQCVSDEGDRRFVIEADGFDEGLFVAPIRVTAITDNGDRNVLNPERASLETEFELGVLQSTTLVMRDVVVGVGKIGENQRGEIVIPSLQIMGLSTQDVSEVVSTQSLLQRGDQLSPYNLRIKNSAANLRRHIVALDNHVAGRIGQRWAVSMLPLLAILLGSVLAIRYTNKMPLEVYALVFVPAVIALLLVFSGGQMIRDANVGTGFFVMWIGNIALVLFVILNWLKLRAT
ncbi:MAG: LptF/LptG family permease [Phycisphaerae bacterium]|jgi:lipopolysaccharide export system permease protein|nr:LptF/LptG family permease [Phycisphaerae bacterium]